MYVPRKILNFFYFFSTLLLYIFNRAHKVFFLEILLIIYSVRLLDSRAIIRTTSMTMRVHNTYNNLFHMKSHI